MRRTAATDAWGAIRSAPWRFLLSAWPWRAACYLALSALIALVALPVLTATILVAPLWGLLFARLERWRVRLLGFAPIRSAHVRLGWDRRSEWLAIRLGEPVTWRELGHLVVSIVLGLFALVPILLGVTAIALPFNALAQPSFSIPIVFFDYSGVAGAPEFLVLLVAALAALLVVSYLNTLLAAAQASIALALLSPRQEELEGQVARLTVSRRSLVRAFGAERRRIERDLHDGAQQQLVALSLSLGIASLELDALAQSGTDVAAARSAVDRAHDQAELALGSLRDSVRGIHPQVLVDHGLAAAIDELVGRLPLRVELDIRLDPRLPAALEASAYLMVSEALTNVIRHGEASVVRITGSRHGGEFALSIVDDGIGGADPRDGSGLAGLRERAEMFGGGLTITSPPGGPTELRVTLPLAAMQGP